MLTQGDRYKGILLLTIHAIEGRHTSFEAEFILQCIPSVVLQRVEREIPLPGESYEDVSGIVRKTSSCMNILPAVSDRRFLRVITLHISTSDGGQVTSKVTSPMTASVDSGIISVSSGP